MSKSNSPDINIEIGGGIGTALAVVLSWTTWKSIWWAIPRLDLCNLLCN